MGTSRGKGGKRSAREEQSATKRYRVIISRASLSQKFLTLIVKKLEGCLRFSWKTSSVTRLPIQSLQERQLLVCWCFETSRPPLSIAFNLQYDKRQEINTEILRNATKSKGKAINQTIGVAY